jgi:hypothetical protein
MISALGSPDAKIAAQNRERIEQAMKDSEQ